MLEKKQIEQFKIDTDRLQQELSRLEEEVSKISVCELFYWNCINKYFEWKEYAKKMLKSSSKLS
tara:strand:+ start:3886 stop:4077 length:192 start_codon:yes stop_codon:yes gene_type:complete